MKKAKIKVYLDTSVYNRPFDDQSQIRIRLETEAFLSILEKAISGSIVIIGQLTGTMTVLPSKASGRHSGATAKRQRLL